MASQKSSPVDLPESNRPNTSSNSLFLNSNYLNPSLEFVIMLVLVLEGNWIWKPWAEGSLGETVTVWTLPNTSSCAPRAVRPKKLKCQSLEQRKIYLQDHARRWVAHSPSSQTWTPQRFQQSILKARWGRGMTGYVISLCRVLSLVDVEVTGLLILSVLVYQ